MSLTADWHQFRILAVDMDGTLAGADHRVTPRTVAVLGQAEQAGLRTVIVTGRTYPTALEVWHGAGLSLPLVTCGGALVVQPPGLSVVQAAFVPEEMPEQALRLGQDLGLMVSLWTRDALWVTEPGPAADTLSHLNLMPAPILAPGRPRAPIPYGPEPVLKVMWSGPPDRLDQVQDELIAAMAPLANTSRSMRQFIEATPRAASKVQALTAVLRHSGVAPAQVIAMGDGDNDVEMLELAGLAVVPANAMPAARAAADLVVGHHDREAVADFVAGVLAQRAPPGG